MKGHWCQSMSCDMARTEKIPLMTSNPRRLPKLKMAATTQSKVVAKRAQYESVMASGIKQHIKSYIKGNKVSMSCLSVLAISMAECFGAQQLHTFCYN